MDNRKKMRQVSPEHYLSDSYDEKGRFASYWHQIYEIRRLAPESILEIGVGNALVSGYLKQRGFNLTTADIDEALKPDHVCSVLELPFTNSKFSVVACFEVLEHLPYEDFAAALAELYRVAAGNVLISLPDATRAYRIDIQVPRVGEFKKLVSFPFVSPPAHEFNGEHYWEIGKAGYPLRRITAAMTAQGFLLEKTYRVFEMPYHRFFVLAKRGNADAS